MSSIGMIETKGYVGSVEASEPWSKQPMCHCQTIPIGAV